jgi:Tfp pilus assembly protein PilO
MTFNNTKARLYIFSAIALALLALLILGVRKMNNENAETARLISLSAESETRANTAHTIRSLQDSASEEVQAFENLTLTNERLVPLIESIESVGRALKLDLEIVSVEKKLEGEGGGPQRIRIVIEASGPWGGAFSLVKAIESLPHRVMFENVSLTKGEEGWSTMISLSLYSFN